MNKLEENLGKGFAETTGSLRLYWLGGAGFIVKSSEVTIGIDLYLSNACMGEDGAFKRLTPSPVSPENLRLDWLIASHEHGDHLDTGSIHKLLSPNGATRLICPTTTKAQALLQGVDASRIVELNRGQSADYKGFSIRAVLADHGDGSPDAIGFFLTVAGKVIYFMGDTCFRTDLAHHVAPPDTIDGLLVPINGRYGNPDGREAAYFAQMFKPKAAIPCHYWLFMEHGGDPGAFVECCGRIAPNTEAKVLAIGEGMAL